MANICSLLTQKGSPKSDLREREREREREGKREGERKTEKEGNREASLISSFSRLEFNFFFKYNHQKI